ncbi:MAG: glycosyltransferase [Acidobacteria bacterium]|nr:glycosyltransferase [Acidobacteriota bacterium]MCA1640425.1 glycosyltransferase [Acidobacteriota bacterium]
MRPKLSIVTPSFNQGKFLEETIRSVLDQGYEPLEYIVIDGGSTDESVRIIRRYEKHLAYWVSEKDRGQVHAINKGIERATGDLFAYINSDDVYLPGAFAAVAGYFASHPDCEWLCGDTVMFGEGRETELVRARVPESAAHALSWAYVRLLLDGHRCEHLSAALAKYRLHAASKTVADSKKFEEEFDRSAELYEDRLSGADKRWCRATRYLRRSYAASASGDRREGSRWLVRAALTHPESLAARPFWGCLRRLAAGGGGRARSELG